MNVRSTVLIPMLAVLLYDAPPARAQEPPCRQKFIKICDIDTTNPVCKLLRSPEKPETPQSIHVFLQGLGPLDNTKREDLICARLMGKKTIKQIQTNLSYWRENKPQGTISRHIFNVASTGMGKIDKWYLEMPPDYVPLLRSHKELDELKRSASKSITFDITGDVVEVVPEYIGRDLYTVTIKIDSVELLRVQTPLSNGDLRAQTAVIKTMIKHVYEEYMNTGFDSSPPP